MYIGQITPADSANGEGIRISVFVSGCTNHCEGCFQPQTWDFEYGKEYTKEIEDYIIEEISKPFYAGITILGGEPFEISNQKGILPLIKRIKEEVPNRTIWIYTGFVLDIDLVPGGKRYCEATDEILSLIDIVVDGKFDKDKKNLRLNFRGSTNQRIIDIPKTLSAKTVVLSELNNEV